MFTEVDAWTTDESEAKAAIGKPLSGDHPDLVCVSVHQETEAPIAQPLPPERKNEHGRPVQDPAPPPVPGKSRWRLHYEPRPQDHK